MRLTGDSLRVADTTPAHVGEVAATVAAPLHELRLEMSSMEDVFFASTDDREAA